MNAVHWTYKHFDSLEIKELYAIMRLRSAVFVVEQNCPYLDPDDYDQKAYHLCGWNKNILVAYARILPPGLIYDEASIGRVVTATTYRGSGSGRALMLTAIDKTLLQYHVNAITISAQLYLQEFYISLGFKTVSEPYLEDEIPHIKMLFTK